MTDRSAQPPYRIARKIDLTHMKPATCGTFRSCPANYIGGRMDDQNAPAGWHGLHRDEVGRDLALTEIAPEMRPPHYVLFKSDCGNLLHYVHSSLLPDPE